MKGFLSEERPIRTLREVLQRLREAYCGTIGYEVAPFSSSDCIGLALHYHYISSPLRFAVLH